MKKKRGTARRNVGGVSKAGRPGNRPTRGRAGQPAPDELTPAQMWDALKRGEALELTPEQGAALVRYQTMEQIRAGVEAAKAEAQPIGPAALEHILALYGGNWGVWRLFTEIVRDCRVTPAAFASGLAYAYTTGHADRENARLLFNFADARKMMNADELAVFETLPPVLTIYRGCGVEEPGGGVFGLSWTVSRQIAEFFAWRFNADDRGRVVVSCQIPRAAVFAYFDSRKEQEIITDVEGAAVEVIAREPGPLYWEYMNRRKTPAV